MFIYWNTDNDSFRLKQQNDSFFVHILLFKEELSVVVDKTCNQYDSSSTSIHAYKEKTTPSFRSKIIY